MRRKILIVVGVILCLLVGYYFITTFTDRQTPILYTTFIMVDDTFVKTLAVLDPQAVSSEMMLWDDELLNAENAVWSTSRRKILYTTQSIAGVSRLWIANADGTSRQLIADNLYFWKGMNWGRWSFDDQYIAFRPSTMDQKNIYQPIFELHIQPIKGSTPAIIPDVWAYAWAPASNRIAALCWRPEAISLQILYPDGSPDKVFPATSYPVIKTGIPNLDWSPDERQVLFINRPDVVDPSNAQTYVSELYSLDVTTGNVTQLTDRQHDLMSRNLSCPSWSPNGKWILFTTDYKANAGETGVNELFIVDVVAGEEKRLAEDIAWGCPVWSPNGQEIAFISKQGDPYANGDIFVVNVKTGDVRQLTDNPDTKMFLSW